jgi:hypothetical protein
MREADKEWSFTPVSWIGGKRVRTCPSAYLVDFDTIYPSLKRILPKSLSARMAYLFITDQQSLIDAQLQKIRSDLAQWNRRFNTYYASHIRNRERLLDALNRLTEEDEGVNDFSLAQYQVASLKSLCGSNLLIRHFINKREFLWFVSHHNALYDAVGKIRAFINFYQVFDDNGGEQNEQPL